MKKSISSIISIPKDILNVSLFDNNELKQDVRIKIFKPIKSIVKEFSLKVKYIWVVGSGITFQYSKNSDIDINIAVKDISKEEAKKINIELNKKYNGIVILDNIYPVNYHVVNEPYGLERSEAIYDLYNNHWVKKPKKYTESEIRELIGSCLPNDLLQEVLGQYLKLENIYERYSTTKSKDLIKEFEKEIYIFLDIYNTLREKRRALYVKGNKYPVTKHCISIVYKIAESFGLGKLYHKFESIYENE